MAQYISIRALNRSSRVRVPSVTSLAAPTGQAATPVGTGGTFAAGTYYYKIVATNGSGHSVPSGEVNATVVLNGSVNLSWTAVTGATGYQIWRGTSAGAEDHFQTSSTNSFTDTGVAGTVGTIPTTDTGVNTVTVQLSPTIGAIVDLDQASVRAALRHHDSVGQYVVTATNNTYGASGSKSALPSNS